MQAAGTDMLGTDRHHALSATLAERRQKAPNRATSQTLSSSTSLDNQETHPSQVQPTNLP